MTSAHLPFKRAGVAGRSECEPSRAGHRAGCSGSGAQRSAWGLGGTFRMFTGQSRPMEGFTLAETLVMAGTAGDNGTAGEP